MYFWYPKHTQRSQGCLLHSNCSVVPIGELMTKYLMTANIREQIHLLRKNQWWEVVKSEQHHKRICKIHYKMKNEEIVFVMALYNCNIGGKVTFYRHDTNVQQKTKLILKDLMKQ